MNRKSSKKKSTAKKPAHGLGSGLSKLLGDDTIEEALNQPVDSAADSLAESPGNLKKTAGRGSPSERVTMLPVARLVASADQPRREFAESELRELAQSMRQSGVLQPILVVQDEKQDVYRIVAGERRWRAAQQAGLHEVPVMVRSLTEEQILQVALIENIQRQDLNIIEEAEAYRRLRDDFGHKQDDIADVVGKSRSYVANILRILNLPQSVVEMLRRNELSLGHVRGLVNHADAELLARRMVVEKLNVRQAEALAKSSVGKKPLGKGRSDSVSLRKLHKDLAELFGVKTEIRPSGRGYVISLRFRDTGDLNDFVKIWRGRD